VAIRRIVGLDLGARGVRVAAWTGNHPEVLAPDPWSLGEPASVVLHEHGVHLGREAERHALESPSGYLPSLRRLLGARPTSAAITALAANVPAMLHPGADGELVVAAHAGRYAVPALVARVLQRTRARAEGAIRTEIESAVMTVPAWFGDLERRALMEAARLAELPACALINDTTATALALVDSPREERLYALVDVGASGAQIAIVELADGLLELRAQAASADLGGDELDRRLTRLLQHEVERTHDLALDAPIARLRLRLAAERARIALDREDSTTIRLPYLTWKDGEPLALERAIQAEELVELGRDVADRLGELAAQALRSARVDARELDHVVVVGGAAVTPPLWAALERSFRPASLVRVRREDLPALGAASWAAFGTRQLGEPVVLDQLTVPLRLASGQGRTQTLLARGLPLPARTTRIFATTRDDQAELALDAYEDDGELTIEGRPVGRFVATQLPAGRAGTVQLEVSFGVESSGLFEVAARNLLTGDRVLVERLPATSPLDEAAQHRLRSAGGDPPVELGVRVSTDGVHNLYSAAIGGVRGVFVATDVFPPLGTPLRLALQLGDEVEPLSCEVRVSFIRPPTTTEPPGIGCQFVGLRAAARRAVESFALEREPLLCE